MASSTEENYLKALLALDLEPGKESGSISVSELGQRLGVSVPTANSMVKNLHSKGLVDYQKYKPVSLTQEGRRQAALIVRKHRLTEMFLVDIMGFGWEEVHEIAEQIEHIDSQALFDRMDRMLNHPTNDPHGSPIPNSMGELESNTYASLSNCQVGTAWEIKAIGDSSTDFLKYLNQRGMALGSHLEVLDREPFDASMRVRLNGEKEHLLSQPVCQMLLVEAR
jgi:DtxR family Mn-dependent transcriptional regulator